MPMIDWLMDLRRRPKSWAPWLILLVVAVLAHAPEFGFSLSSNPFYFTSGLQTAAPDGVFQGQPGWNDPNAGFTTEALGGLAARQLLHGRLPWWNPYSGVGLPLAAETQNSALFLPFVLLLNAVNGVLYLKLAMQVLAGFATFALLIQLGMARRVALLGGILYELNGTFAWIAHAPIMPVPFLPLLLLGIERAYTRAGQRRIGGWAWITVATAYSLYAGFPETAFIDGLMGATWATWRLVMAPAAARWRFAGKVAIAGVLGLLLAAPAVLPLLELLPQAYAGVHGVLAIGFDPGNYAMFLVPYLFGPIDYDGHWFMWGNAGGYLTVPLGFLAALALRRQAREFGLRVLLAGWIVVAIAVSAQLPLISDLLNAIPFVRDIWFSRYAVPSWEMAAILLTAFALDDWQRGARFGGRLATLIVAIWGAVTLVALLPAAPMILDLLHDRPAYGDMLSGSLLSTAVMATAIAVVVAARCTPRRSLLAGVLLAGQAIALFAFPLLAGTRTQSYDGAAVAFLQANLGLSRFYTLGPFAPNYGALFGVASINHNYLPVPRLWVDYIRAHLDPAADDVSFTGTFPAAPPGGETRAEALRRRQAAYAALGVKFVLTPPGIDPFVATAGITPAPAGAIIQPLSAGQSLSGVVPADHVRAGSIDSAAVVIGTYGGASDGVLTVRLCTTRDCVDGSVPLATAPDNAFVALPFATPLTVQPGDDLRYQLRHVTGSHVVAVYLWPHSGRPPDALPPTNTPGGVEPGYAPALVLTYPPAQPRPQLVYHDAVMNIYALPAPAPYFEVRGGPCDLTPMGRREIRTDCQATATLIRRELFFPGWHAEMNGTAVPISQFDQIVQAVQLAPGQQEVRFTYAPPHIGWAYAAFVAGAIGLLANLIMPGAARDRRTEPASPVGGARPLWGPAGQTPDHTSFPGS